MKAISSRPTIARQRADNARGCAKRRGSPPRRSRAPIEEIARRELGLIKPGERVFIIKDITPKK